jgi:hypothetical protein
MDILDLVGQTSSLELDKNSPPLGARIKEMVSTEEAMARHLNHWKGRRGWGHPPGRTEIPQGFEPNQAPPREYVLGSKVADVLPSPHAQTAEQMGLPSGIPGRAILPQPQRLRPSEERRRPGAPRGTSPGQILSWPTALAGHTGEASRPLLSRRRSLGRSRSRPSGMTSPSWGRPWPTASHPSDSTTPPQPKSQGPSFTLGRTPGVHRGAHYTAPRATEAYEEARRKVAAFNWASGHGSAILAMGTTEGPDLAAQVFAKPWLVPGATRYS